MRARTHTAAVCAPEPTSATAGVPDTTSSTSPHTSQPRQLPPGAVPMPGIAMSPISASNRSGNTDVVGNTAAVTSDATSGNHIRGNGTAAGGSTSSASAKATGLNGIHMADSLASPPARTALSPVSSTPTPQSPNVSVVELSPSSNATSSAQVFELRDYPRRVLNGEVVVSSAQTVVKTQLIILILLSYHK